MVSHRIDGKGTTCTLLAKVRNHIGIIIRHKCFSVKNEKKEKGRKYPLHISQNHCGYTRKSAVMFLAF